jgi:cysteine-rich repeat protein
MVRLQEGPILKPVLLSLLALVFLSAAPQVAAANVCGDFVVAGGEECDFGSDQPTIAVGADFSCALDDDGVVSCSGNTASGDLDDQETGLTTIVGQKNEICGLTEEDSEILCWRVSREVVDVQVLCDPDPENDLPPADEEDCTENQLELYCTRPFDADPPGMNGVWRAVDGSEACFLRSEWGLSTLNDESGEPEVLASGVPSGEFVSIVTSSTHKCGLRPNGRAECWGPWLPRDRSHPGCTLGNLFPYCPELTDEVDRVASNEGPFVGLASGSNFNCGILLEDRSLFCWGDNAILYSEGPSTQATLPTGEFVQVVASDRTLCALRVDRSVACVGDNASDLATPPGDAFRQLTAGKSHMCGLKVDGTIACWGADTKGQLDAPAGQFLQVVAGDDHSCATDAAGTVECWGGGADAAWATGPSGSFLAAGLRYGDGCSSECEDEAGWDCSGDLCETTCGDGIATGFETCDDSTTPGGLADGDGCSAECRAEPGFLCDRSSSPTSCDDVCDDGTIDISETCEPGEFSGLQAECEAFTGDGGGCSSLIADFGLEEHCEAAGTDDQCRLRDDVTCTSAAEAEELDSHRSCSRCGDGWVGGLEQCDDGNSNAGDGCVDCLIERPPLSNDTYECPAEPVHSGLIPEDATVPVWWPLGGICTKVPDCGNGRIDGGEECDDGNTDSEDGCSDECVIEEDYACAEGVDASMEGTPYFLVSSCDICGNGLLNTLAGEECDDGNLDDDCCSSNCKFEAEGLTCGDSADSICSNPDTCDGQGSCDANDEPPGTSCGQPGGECKTGDLCDGSGTCQSGEYSSSDTVCREADGECDVAETCDGVSASCPSNSFQSSGTECGEAGTTCSDQDTCDGSGTCAANHKAAGVSCPDDGEICTEDLCDGSGQCAHPPGNAGDVCRSVTGIDASCDPDEVCDGTSATCPADVYEVAGTSCDDGNPATEDDTCQLGICGCAEGPDLDGDLVPDLCDLDDGDLALYKALVKYKIKKVGSVKLKGGVFQNPVAGEPVPAFDQGVTVRVEQGGSEVRTITFGPEDCRGNNVRVFRCFQSNSKTDKPKLQVRSKVLRGFPPRVSWDFKLVFGDVTADGPLGGDPSEIGVSLSLGDVDLHGSMSGCRVLPQKTVCKGP